MGKPKKERRKRLKPPSPEISDGSVRYPFVAICGRPNVGKSTLFNRLVGHRLAITEPTAGTTRDRIAALVHLHDGRTIEVCDMGGLGGTGDPHDADVNHQIDLALQYADIVIFMVDARDGLMPMDETIARRLKRMGKPVLLVANKADTRDLEITAAEFYSLGFEGDIICTSARDGFGRTDVLEALAKVVAADAPVRAPAAAGAAPADDEFEEDDADADDAGDEHEGDEPEGDEHEDDGEDEADDEGDAPADAVDADPYDDGEEDTLDEEGEVFEVPESELGPPLADPNELDRPLRIAIVGRRNVGKSTYLNRLVGDERVITSPRPGTTRDAVDVLVELMGKKVVLIDTAGLRKRGRFDDHIEIISHGRSLEAVKRSDVCFLMLDAIDKISHVDKKLAGAIGVEHKPCVVIANKWDLVKDRMNIDEYANYVALSMPGIEYAPVVTVSAKDGTHANAPVEVAYELFAQSRLRVRTGPLNRAIAKAIERRRPRASHGRQGRVYFGTQIAQSPVTLLLFVNEPELFGGAWLRYLRNQLRRSLPWKEIPIKLVLRSRMSLAKKSGMIARRLDGMGALADQSRWIDDAPETNVKTLAETLDRDVVRDVLMRTLGRDEDEMGGDDEDASP